MIFPLVPRLGSTIALALASASAFAISRVGNAKIGDQELGFAVTIPRDFSVSKLTPDHGVNLAAPRSVFSPRASTFVSAPLFLFVRESASFRPELSSLSRPDLQLQLSSLGWTSVSVANPCVDAYQFHSSSTDELLIVWGVGIGATFVGESNSQTRTALGEILAGFELSPGFCRWP